VDVRQKVLDQLTYGLYIVTSRVDRDLNGQISDALMQVTAFPPRVAVSINKEGLTHEYISKSGVFAVSVLARSTPMRFIGLFGFRSGRDVNKLAQVSHKTGVTGCPLVLENCVAAFEATVVERVDLGSHTVFIADVVRAEVLHPGPTLTYEYYTRHLKGKVPRNSPTYRGDAAAPQRRDGTGHGKKYVCEVCGYVYDPEVGDPVGRVPPGTPFEDLPEDWVCPICGAAKDLFSEGTRPSTGR